MSKAGVILIKGGSVYLVCGRKHHKWGFPKGSIEDGESPMECAKRELLEETGMVGFFNEEDEIKLYGHSFFICNEYSRVFKKTIDNGEISNSKWFKFDSLPDKKSWTGYLKRFMKFKFKKINSDIQIHNHCYLETHDETSTIKKDCKGVVSRRDEGVGGALYRAYVGCYNGGGRSRGSSSYLWRRRCD